MSDAEEPWTYRHKFDYIHSRDLVYCFRDPTQIIAKAYNALIPDSVLEMQDPQMPIACVDKSMDGRPLAKWAAETCRTAERLGRPLTNSRHYGRWMRDAGFVDAKINC